MPHSLRRRPWWLALSLAAIVAVWSAAERGFFDAWAGDRGNAPPLSLPMPSEGLQRIGALGRLEPEQGVVRLAGPPRAAVVIERLFVEEGDRVEAGDVVASLMGIGVQRAEVSRFEAELANAERDLERNRKLHSDGVLSDTAWNAVLLARDVAKANVESARAELSLSTVRSPIAGRVLEIHAREGERVGVDGIAELGNTGAMYAVAEVYENDISRVRIGQRASVRSPALIEELTGVVERIGLKIGKKDVLSTDPVADADARVVEVEIRLDQPELVAGLTNLRVDVVIEP